MQKFEIYAGLSGGFGGASLEGVYEFDNMYEALDFARDCAFEQYTSYEGANGVLSWNECKADLLDSGFDSDDDDVDTRYMEEVESWIEYYVEPVDEAE